MHNEVSCKPGGNNNTIFELLSPLFIISFKLLSSGIILNKYETLRPINTLFKKLLICVASVDQVRDNNDYFVNLQVCPNFSNLNILET